MKKKVDDVRYAYIFLFIWMVLQLGYIAHLPNRIFFLHATMISGCVNLGYVLSVCLNDKIAEKTPYFLLLLTGVLTLLYSLDVFVIIEHLRQGQAAFER